jgi:SpoVK/Ycf46/Vps4 family AAA+-type ATPase
MVSTAHRFLHGRTPQTPDKQIWVLSGQVQDWFYHDLLWGCVGIRESLQHWARAGGLELTVTLDRAGRLDFSGNPDPAEAERRFEEARPRREPRYAGTRRRGGGGAAPTEADDAEAARREEAARQARDAAGGAGQAILNTAGRLTQLLQSAAVPSLVIVDGFVELLRRLDANAQTAPVAAELVEIVQNEWHARIARPHRLVFLTIDPRGLEPVFSPRDTFSNVDWRHLGGPADEEIRAAIERFSRRRGFAVRGTEPIARALVGTGSLRNALNNVARVVAAGGGDPSSPGAPAAPPMVTLEAVLQRPALNEDAVRRVLREIDGLTGLDEVKEKLRQVERSARALRSRLADGDPRLPDATLHMVFTGGPGTGKTTVARLVARLFHALGLLPRDQVREVVASSVMSSFTGETSEKMRKELEEARGGVLFIDEAHQFGDPASSQAREAVNALVPMAWNLRHEMAIILAGYADRMHAFFAMDPGLDRRFPPQNRMTFRDFTADELWAILERRLQDEGFVLEPAAVPRLRAVLQRRARRRSFGNAGGVENLLHEVLERHRASSAAQSPTLTQADLPPLIRRDPQALTEAMRQLDGMIGLGPVREQIETILARLEFELRQEERGRGSGRLTLHPGNMLFTGPPGTGKTTVAKLMAPLLYGIGVIERPVGVEAGRSTLVAGYQGQSALAVRKAVDQARDGVLFVDEAYSLVQGDGDSFGREALDELLGQITRDENDGTVFILAGYPDRIRGLLGTNQGLTRRFPVTIEFPHFTPADCVAYARILIGREHLSADAEVLDHVAALAAAARAAEGEHFGNAGWVANLVAGAKGQLALRVHRAGFTAEHSELERLRVADFPSLPATRAAGPVPVAATWTPSPDAREIASARPAWTAAPLEDVVEEVQAATFQVLTRRHDGTQGTATAFFVTADGVAATAAHVVEGAAEVLVCCGAGRTPRPARVVAQDTDLDLALLAVNDGTGAAYLPLGESRRIRPPAGLVVAGNAHVQPGEGGRVVLARVVRNQRTNDRELETDGAIEPGFSGGPAVEHAQGAVVGVVTGGYGPSATLLVRSEQVREMLAGLGYRFSNTGHP